MRRRQNYLQRCARSQERSKQKKFSLVIVTLFAARARLFNVDNQPPPTRQLSTSNFPMSDSTILIVAEAKAIEKLLRARAHALAASCSARNMRAELKKGKKLRNK